MNFFEALKTEVSSHLYNNHSDNWDHLRFGKVEGRPKNAIKAYLQNLVRRRGYYHLTAIETILSNSLQVHYFKYLYNNLSDENDRRVLLNVLAFRILGYKKVRLPLSTPEYWKKINEIENLADKTDFIDPEFLDVILYRINLQKIGFPIDMYFSCAGIVSDFIIKQYEYNKGKTIIKAEKGDFVIDGGGCWGDTALYFANEVGADGKVYSFEFIPKNIGIFEKNRELNKSLKERIELIRNPLWIDSETKLYYKDYGPGSNVSMKPFNDQDGECITASLDEMIVNGSIEKIDFIKMDIEGAELNALKGAAESIKKFKPKLAIALYHSMEEFHSIPHFIKELVPEYKLYFSHCTINAEESILFAKVS
jgi:FkbM family methyltransferase